MTNGVQKRTRGERVASIDLAPGRWGRVWQALRRGDVLVRLALSVAGVGLVWGATEGWQPPFRFRAGHTPARDLVVRLEFRDYDTQATESARERARAQVRYVYAQDAEPLAQLRGALVRRLVEAQSAQNAVSLPEGMWSEFHPDAATNGEVSALEREAEFQRLRAALSGEGAEAVLEKSLGQALEPYELHGLLDKLPQELDQGNQQEIFVHPVGQPTERHLVKITDVLIGDGSVLERRLAEKLPAAEPAAWALAWLRSRITSTKTLTLNAEETRVAREAAVAAVPDAFRVYSPGHVLARSGVALDAATLELLRLEHDALVASQTWRERAARSTSILGLCVALCALCGYYVVRREPRIWNSLGKFLTLWLLVVATVVLARVAGQDAWRAELIPLLLFAMTVAVVHNQELALLLAAAVALVMALTLGIGPEISSFVVLAGAASTAVLLLTRIRTRSKLIQVGVWTALAAGLLTFGAGVLTDQPLGKPLLSAAGLHAIWALTAGFLMLGLLSPIETTFGVLTEFRLLELSDSEVGRPLLQQLISRAPGTYNHSINVASLAEAAAEAIGANGLLVRVGAYFHDIGKLLKPSYFVENGAQNEGSRHDGLMPAMSTLVIIAHVKDGADLARQHHLPEPLVDFIEQHHGTTIVEYFYRRASEQQELDPSGSAVDESHYRYPGPKPQTREAAVLMLADAVESAARTLVEPTSARIEGLVNELALQRLLDGQFDECGLSLRALRAVQDSLVKSLVAMYHGRVKYPNQRTA